MDVKEKLVEIVKRAAYSCLPSNTEDFHLNMFVTDLLAHGVTVQEWISVKDRLPDTDDWVLVCGETVETGYTTIVVDICAFTVGGDRMWFTEYATWKQVVTHWMPLPQPPKGERL